MEGMLYKFIDEGKREHKEMRAFIHEFRTKNELLFKERNNSLSELMFEVQGLLRVINNTSISNLEFKGVTTRGGKTTTQDVQDNDTNIHTKKPLVINHDEPVELNEVLAEDQPQKTDEPVVRPTSEVQTPPIPFPQRLRKEKEEAQQKKFLENLKQLHINLPFIEALAQMPKYAKILKEEDPGSFTIPCDIGKLHINNELADLGASISLMTYTMYEKLGLGEPKATRMSLELADRSIQYPRGIVENVLNKVDKFVLPIDFVVLDMPEDSRVPIILGRPFLATARAMIDMFNKKITLRVGDDEVFFDMDQSIKRPPAEDGLEKSIDQSDLESYESFECDSVNDSDSGEPIQRIESVNTPYPVAQKTTEPNKVKTEQLYLTSANEIDDKKPELKKLPQHLERIPTWRQIFSYNYSSKLSEREKMLLLQVLEKLIQPQRHLNPKVQDMMKKEIVKQLDSGLIYPILDSSWVSPIHMVPKKGGMAIVLNDNNELIPSRTVTGWRVCIDYRKLNDATRKDHFPLLFIDQMLKRLCGNKYYCFLNGFSGCFQILIAPEDQEKTTFTCPYGTFAYRRMPFGLCNAPATFQRCMTAIFHNMVEDFMEVFMDDFSVFHNSFDCCLANLDKMLARCEETNLVLNWENVILCKKLMTKFWDMIQSDVAFIEWSGSKFFNYKTMDHYTMKALWIYWIRGDDEVELTDEESSDDMDEVAEVFRIDTNC
ncbi:putative nucleotidyltransferase, ribonuclease H [Tanacetum coccineum]